MTDSDCRFLLFLYIFQYIYSSKISLIQYFFKFLFPPFLRLWLFQGLCNDIIFNQFFLVQPPQHRTRPRSVPTSPRFHPHLLSFTMSRTPRNFKASSFYHVFNRGNNKDTIFRSSSDKQFFLNLLYKYHRECEIKILTYCIMETHFHLVIRTGKNPKLLSKFMQKVCTGFAMQVNRKHQRVGHVFQNRYNANYLPYKKDIRRAIDYVRKNPVQEGWVRKPSEYKWSKRE